MGNLLHLTPLDVKIVAMLKSTGVFRDLIENEIASPNGTVCVACPDGDRFPELFNHHSKTCQCSRHHPLALNGGAIIMPRNEIAERMDVLVDGDVIMKHLGGAMKLKGYDAVALYVHAPCGMAYSHGLNLMTVMEQLMAAKARVRKEFGQSIKIHPLCHVAYPDGKQKTYFVDRKKWEELPALGCEDDVLKFHPSLRPSPTDTVGAG